jgi:predicted chitinase
MTIHTNFFNSVRASLFNGKLSTQQVITMEKMLDFWETHFQNDPISRLAYTLATAYHETDRTFGPIREYGRGKGKRYGTTYYGRGLVQLTWEDNYRKMGDKLGIDLVDDPDRALDVDTAVAIIFVGMTNGMFTGKSYNDYLTKKKTDYVQARRIINALDKAALIAGYARKFEAALLDTGGYEVAAV